MGDHFAAMREFYTTILKPLGYALFVDVKGSHCGFKNKDDIPDVWLGRGRKNGPKKYDGDLSNRLAPIHVAFTGNDRKHVDEWHEAAVRVELFTLGQET